MIFTKQKFLIKQKSTDIRNLCDFKKHDNKLELSFSYSSQNTYLGENAEMKMENSKVIFENTGKIVSISGLFSAKNIDLSKLNNSGDSSALTGTIDVTTAIELNF